MQLSTAGKKWSQYMKFLRNDSTDPYFNMAFDEYCLTRYESEEPFFYLWRNRASVIIGYNQNVYNEVNLDFIESQGIMLARRITGGGAVYHDQNNLNYSIIGKDISPSVFAESLQKLGLNAELGGRNDIFVEGKKISGYARRLSLGQASRELIHGTLMYDVDIDTLTWALNVEGLSKLNLKGVKSVRSRVGNIKDYLPQFDSLDGLQEALQNIMADGDGELSLSPEALKEIETLAREKFAVREWIYN